MLRFLEPFIENILIYYENISYFYVFCISISFIAVGLSWSVDEKRHQDDTTEENVEEDEDVETSEKQSKKKLLDSVAESMTNIDLQQEKEIEKQQLANIYELIQKDRDKFRIESLQELEEQMKLYRE